MNSILSSGDILFSERPENGVFRGEGGSDGKERSEKWLSGWLTDTSRNVYNKSTRKEWEKRRKGMRKESGINTSDDKNICFRREEYMFRAIRIYVLKEKKQCCKRQE